MSDLHVIDCDIHNQIGDVEQLLDARMRAAVYPVQVLDGRVLVQA
jgi:hypothetical protein